MRITQVILSKQLGGAERHVADLSNHLVRRHDVQVILRKAPSRYAALKHGGNIASLLAPGILCQEAGGPFRNRQIRRFIRDFRPDVIHTHLGDAGKSLRWIRPDVPLIGTLHGEYKDKCYREHDALICVSEWQRRTIPGSFSGEVVAIPNFIAGRERLPGPEIGALRTQLGIAPNTTVIGAVGRFAPEKGFDTLLHAFAHAKLKDSILLLVGDGPERPRLELRGIDGVRFAGWQADPWPFYSLFDVFVIPSRYEPFGIVVLEALQAGIPVISTRTDGPLEILEDGAGILVGIDDAEAMAEALRQLASSPDLRTRLAAAGRRRAEDFDIDAVVPRIEALYRETIR